MRRFVRGPNNSFLSANTSLLAIHSNGTALTDVEAHETSSDSFRDLKSTAMQSVHLDLQKSSIFVIGFSNLSEKAALSEIVRVGRNTVWRLPPSGAGEAGVRVCKASTPATSYRTAA